MNSLHKIIILYILLLFVGCQQTEKEDTRPKLAQVGDKVLYEEEVISRIPLGLKGNDSLDFIQQYVEKWIEEEVVLQEAEIQLPDEAKDVEQQLEDYKKSLLIFAYEQKFIEQRMDTLVTEDEIVDYYNNHPDDFMLRDFIVRALYGKFPINAPDLDKAKKWYKSTEETDLVNMEAYANNFALQFNYSKDDWIYFDDVLKVVPIEDIDPKSFIRKKKKITFEDSANVYFVNILDYKLKDAQSPLSFEREKIKGIILTLRANEMRLKLKADLLKDAKNNGKIIKFDHE